MLMDNLFIGNKELLMIAFFRCLDMINNPVHIKNCKTFFVQFY